MNKRMYALAFLMLGGISHGFTQQPDWENEQVFGINKQPPCYVCTLCYYSTGDGECGSGFAVVLFVEWQLEIQLGKATLGKAG